MAKGEGRVLEDGGREFLIKILIQTINVVPIHVYILRTSSVFLYTTMLFFPDYTYIHEYNRTYSHSPSTSFGNILTKTIDSHGEYGVFAGVYLKNTAAKLQAECSSRCVPILLDVSKQASVDDAARQIKAYLNANGHSLHGVVNNAGTLCVLNVRV